MTKTNEYVKNLIFSAGLGAVLGGLVGLGLSFTALSPLVIGGIIGSILLILPTVSIIGFYGFSLVKDADEKGESENFRAIRVKLRDCEQI